MNLSNITDWLRQATTGSGVAALAATATAWGSGHLSGGLAAAGVVFSAVAVAWPEKAPAVEATKVLVTDISKVRDAYLTGLSHGQTPLLSAVGAAQTAAPLIGDVGSLIGALEDNTKATVASSKAVTAATAADAATVAAVPVPVPVTVVGDATKVVAPTAAVAA